MHCVTFPISSHRKTRIYLTLDTVEARMGWWLEVLSAGEILGVVNDSEDGDRLLFAAESFAVWQVFWSVGGYWTAFILLGTNVCHFICSFFQFSGHCYIRKVSVQHILKIVVLDWSIIWSSPGVWEKCLPHFQVHTEVTEFFMSPGVDGEYQLTSVKKQMRNKQTF